MRALFHASHNQPRYHLLPGTLPIPAAAAGKALIRVRAAAVTANDVAGLAAHAGLHVPGTALSGELVTATSGLPAGARVAAVCARGAWAEYALVAEACVWEVASSFEEAAALAAVATGCLQGVRAAALKAGELVVVSGGVTAAGCVVAQLAARVYGARVVLGVRGESQMAVGRLIGAEGVVDRDREKVKERYAGETFVAGFDTSGEACKLAKIVEKGGRVVRVMPLDSEKAGECCRKRDVELIDVAQRCDDKAAGVVTEVLKNMKVRAACGPVYGIAKWMRAMEAAEGRVDAGCVVIMF